MSLNPGTMLQWQPATTKNGFGVQQVCLHLVSDPIWQLKNTHIQE